MSGRRPPAWSAPVAIFAAGLAAWEAAVALGWLRPIQFPPPTRLADTAFELAFEGFPGGVTLADHVVVTCLRVLAGFAAAVALAVPLGVLIGRNPWLDRASAPVVAFCRSVATLSLLPLAVVWFGAGEGARLFLIGYGCFWVMLSAAIAAIKLVDPVLVDAARTMDTPPRRLFLEVVLPAAAPRLAAGARTSLGVGFMVIVGAEMIGTLRGLGALIMEARTFYRSDITMVGMAVIGAVGLALAWGLGRLETWLLPWRAREPGGGA
jgi:ABC-type nitrate/sulfonate/bicarbonate transport system permease component